MSTGSMFRAPHCDTNSEETVNMNKLRWGGGIVVEYNQRILRRGSWIVPVLVFIVVATVMGSGAGGVVLLVSIRNEFGASFTSGDMHGIV